MDGQENDRDEPARGSRTGVVIGAIAVAAVAAIGGWWFWGRSAPAPTAVVPASPAPTSAATAPAAAPVPLEEAPDAPSVAPGDGDALLRRLAAGLSPSPELAQWLAAESILQRLAASVSMAAAGGNPRPMLTFLELKGPFTVDEQIEKKPAAEGERVEFTERDFIAPASYARYDALTGLVTSIDPAAAGRAYAQLRRYFGAAFTQIAKPGERFDGVLKAAIDRLQAVPIPSGPVEVVPAGAMFKYADPALEGLRPVEKQFLRFGPTNQAALKAWLQGFGAQAGLR